MEVGQGRNGETTAPVERDLRERVGNLTLRNGTN
jgi:hypothetical protein